MSGRVVLHDRARADLIRISAYISLDNASAADSVFHAAQGTFQLLADYPLLGRRHRIRRRGLSQLRKWPLHGYPMYLVYYLPLTDGAAILHIRHTARDPRRAF